ncbi:MAG: hypothetical protein Alpg2KO_26970 [Alphaproteobacteria bacterium]
MSRFLDIARDIVATDPDQPEQGGVATQSKAPSDGRLSMDAVTAMHKRFKANIRADVAKAVDIDASPELATALTRLAISVRRANRSIKPKQMKKLAASGLDAVAEEQAKYTTEDKLKVGGMDEALVEAEKRKHKVFPELFGDEDRIYMEANLPKTSPVQGMIEEVLKAEGYEHIDYAAGLASTDGKNPTKIGRLLTKMDPVLAHAYGKDPARSGDLMIMVSRDPADIAGMSADRGWMSCLSPDYSPYHYGDNMRRNLQADSLVAYLVAKDDPLALKPLSRVHIKPYFSDGVMKTGIGKRTMLYAGKNYGLPISSFQHQVQGWLDESFNEGKTGKFSAGRAYVDINEPREIGRVAPGLGIEDVLKKLDIEYKKGFTGKITVSGNLTLAAFNYLPEGLNKIEVEGTLNVSGIPMEEMSGLPDKIGGSLIALNCGLRSWDGAPKRIERDLDVSSNEFVDLQGCPETVRGEFRIGANPLVSFDGAPKEFGRIKIAEFEYYYQNDLPARPKAAEPPQKKDGGQPAPR